MADLGTAGKGSVKQTSGNELQASLFVSNFVSQVRFHKNYFSLQAFFLDLQQPCMFILVRRKNDEYFSRQTQKAAGLRRVSHLLKGL